MAKVSNKPVINNEGPLQGINVLDMGTAGVGPFAATLLGYLGANVIKLEPPFLDMLYRQLPTQKGVSAAYLYSNLNKRNIVLDLKDKANNWGHFERLIRDADVVMENQRPGSLARLGVTYEALQSLNPRIIYLSCPGYGMTGPMKEWFCAAGHAEAFSGFSSLTGPMGGRPEMLRYPLMDPNASCYITAAVLLAMNARERTGQSQRVTLSQLGSSVAVQINRIGEYFLTGEAPVPLGSAASYSAPHQAFLCQDKRYLALGVVNQAQWLALCRAIGKEDLASDHKFATNVKRVANRQALTAVLEPVFLSRPARWWCLRLAQNQVPAGYFEDDVMAVPDHAQSIENDFFTVLDFPKQGKMMYGTFPWRFSKNTPYMTPAPLQGEDTEDVISGGFGARAHSSAAKVQNGLTPGQAPLKGMRVVDLTQGLCGPYTALLLAESGAEVTKIEPPDGDYAREFAPQHPSGVSVAYHILNRNKRVIRQDLSTRQGKAALKEMIKGADILLIDWTPTVEKELGLETKALEKLNGSLIYCAISPFGEKGPMRGLPGAELVVQAAAGYHNYTGRIGEPPIRVGADIANMDTAVVTFQGILAALFARFQTGVGQRVSTSQFGTLNTLLAYSHSGIYDPDDWIGLYCDAFVQPPTWGYKTKDGEVILMMRDTTEEQFYTMCRDLGMQKVLDADPRFQNLTQNPRGLRRAMLWDTREVWEEYLSKKTTAEVVEIAWRNSVTPPAFNNLRQIFEHEQVKAIDMVRTLNTAKGGQQKFLTAPWHGAWQEVAPALPES